jgi:hypothetical protein
MRSHFWVLARNGLSWYPNRFPVVLLSPSWQIPVQCIKLGHYCFLPYTVSFINHSVVRRYTMGYKPEVTDPQHTKIDIFKGKDTNKTVRSEIVGLLSSICKEICYELSIHFIMFVTFQNLSFGYRSCNFDFTKRQAYSTHTRARARARTHRRTT